MTGFIAIGVVGLLIVLGSLLLGEVLDGLFDSVGLDSGGGVFSAPVIGSFLAAFGFGAALIMYGADVGVAPAAVGGVGAGAVLGGIAYIFTRSLMQMPTDEPVRVADMVGTRATVVTRIPPSGLGEVSMSVRGQLLKLSARSDQPIEAGRQVVVTAVTSPSSVVVEPAATP